MLPIPASVAQQAASNAPLNALTFVYFSLRPDSKLLSTQQQATALALSILMGVFTLGIGHLVCKIICEIKKHQVNELLNKITNIAKKELGCSEQLLHDAAGVFIILGLAQKNEELTEEEINDLLTEEQKAILLNFNGFMEAKTLEQQAALKSRIMSLLPTNKQEVIRLIGLPVLETLDNHLRSVHQSRQIA